MISDTLHAALEEIEEYQKSMPQCYDGLRGEIGKVKAVMDALRAFLDLPPSLGRYPQYDAAVTRLRVEIAGINVDGLQDALECVTDSWPTLEGGEASSRSSPKKGPGLGYDPQEVLARAIGVWTRGGGREQPCSAASEVDTVKNEVHLRNVNGLLVIYKLGRNGEIWRTVEG